jgi:SAM-dependent methyltransferase
VVELLAPAAGERILDLGCGDGAITARLVQLGCSVVGVDTSAELLAAARAQGLDVRRMDGQALAFDGEFDAVFSNAALHWMTSPDAVIAGVWRALKPGGRFVGELGGAGNVARICEALLAALARRGIDGRAVFPWYFPSRAEYQGLLQAAGFVVRSIELFARPTPLPTGLEGWLRTFAGPFLAHVPPAEHHAMLAEVAQATGPSLRDPAGGWVADYVRLRFAADKPRR